MDKQYFKGPFKGARQIAIADSVADALQGVFNDKKKVRKSA